jgi:hypothetical protein
MPRNAEKYGPAPVPVESSRKWFSYNGLSTDVVSYRIDYTMRTASAGGARNAEDDMDPVPMGLIKTGLDIVQHNSQFGGHLSPEG